MNMTVAQLRTALEGVPDDMPVLVQLNFVVGDADFAGVTEIEVGDLAQSYRDRLEDYDYENPPKISAFLIAPDIDDYLLSRRET